MSVYGIVEYNSLSPRHILFKFLDTDAIKLRTLDYTEKV